MSHRISPTKALALITDFVLHPTLSGISQTMGLGGTFTKTVFDKFTANETKDLLFWFCYRKAEGAITAKLFIALEPEPTAVNPGSLPNAPIANTLTITTDHFNYSGSISAKGVESFFCSQSGIQNSDSNISKSEVSNFCGAFVTLFPSGSNNPYNSSQLGYIQNYPNKDLADFITQSNEIAGVRYFFGFDADETNKIKVIFVPIDAQGKNILKFSNGSTPFYLDREEP